MRKNFEQPELMVVRVMKNDIITMSVNASKEVDVQYSGDRMGREDWDAGY